MSNESFTVTNIVTLAFYRIILKIDINDDKGKD